MSERGPEFGSMAAQEIPKDAGMEKREAAELPSSEEVDVEMGLCMDGDEGAEVVRFADERGLSQLALIVAEEEGRHVLAYVYNRSGEQGLPTISREDIYDDKPSVRRTLSRFENGGWKR